jgi:hypothetical protein
MWMGKIEDVYAGPKTLPSTPGKEEEAWIMARADSVRVGNIPKQENGSPVTALTQL